MHCIEAGTGHRSQIPSLDITSASTGAIAIAAGKQGNYV